MSTDFTQNSSEIVEYLLRNKGWGVFGEWLGLSATGSSSADLDYDFIQENSHKVIAIIKERLRDYKESLVSAVLGTPDFLSSSFLKTGEKQSIAVCRIDRNLSLAEFQAIIEEIQDLESIGNFNSNFDSVEKLQEIFAIPQQIADEIFQRQSTPLEELKSNISEKHLAKLNPIPVGTGFLVGGTYLMTNHHVIPDEKVAEQCVAEFNYVEDALGDAQTSVYYEFDPKTLFVSNPNLDYTLVQLKTSILKKPPGYVFGWIDLRESESNISPGLNKEQVQKHLLAAGFTDEQLRAKGLTIDDGNILGDRVIIVQHPKGRHKQIVLNNNRVINNGLYKKFLRYTADSDYGGSGSPVFNTKWELVALHHAAIAKDTNQGDQTQPENGQRESKIEVFAQQGVRICRIIEDLKRKSLSQPKLKSFIQDFVITSEQLKYPPLSSALEFDGVRDYVNLSGKIQEVDFIEIELAATYSDGTVKLWQKDGLEIGTFSCIDAESIVYFSFGLEEQYENETPHLATTSKEGFTRLWNLHGNLQGSWTKDEQFNHINFSPNGTKLSIEDIPNLLDSQKNAVRPGSFVWSSGKSQHFSSVIFSPDDTRLLTASDDGDVNTPDDGFIRLWDLRANQHQQFNGYTARFHHISSNPNETLIAIASQDSPPQLWDWQGTQRAVFDKESRNQVSFSPDSQLIATISDDFSTVRLWNWEGKLQGELEGDGSSVVGVKFSNNGNLIAILWLSSIWVWDWQSNHKVVLKGDDGEWFSSVTFSPDGQLVATLLNNGNAVLWNWQSNHKVVLKGDDGEWFSSVTFSPNGQLVATTSNSVRLWNLEGHPKQSLFKVDNEWFESISFSPNGQLIAISSDESSTVRMWDWQRNQQALLKGHTKGITSVSFSSDGELMATASRDGTVRLWKLPEYKQVQLLCINQLLNVSCLSDDPPRLTTTSKEGITKQWNLAGDQQEQTNKVNSLSFSLEEELIATASDDGTVRLWDLSKNQQVMLNEHNQRVNSVSFSPDSQLIATASDDGTVKLWGQNGSLHHTLKHHLPCTSVSFNYRRLNKWQYYYSYYQDSLFSFGRAQPFSIEAWVNPYPDGKGGVIISKCYVDKPLEGEYILGITEYGHVEFSRFPNDHRLSTWHQKSQLVTYRDLPFGEFSHIAATYDGKAMKIYINGKQDENDSSPVLQNHNTFIPVVVGASLNSPDSIEGNYYSPFKHFKGVIAEVRLWKTARNEEEIKANMYRRLNTQQETDKGLVGYWRFEAGNDNKVYNLASRNQQGIIYTEKWLNAHSFPPVPLPFGLQFDGEDNYVDCGNDESLKITDAITVEAWVKHNYGDGLIVDKMAGDGEDEDKNGYSLSLSSGKIRVELHNPIIFSELAQKLAQSKIPERQQQLIDEAKTAKTILDTQNSLPRDNAWHHIAFTWGNTPQTATSGNTSNELPEVEVYIDGRRQNIVVIEGQAKSILVEGQYKTVGLFKGPIGTPRQNLSIGGRENGIYLNGSIAEVRLWKVARTQNQINANMYQRLNISQEELEKSKEEGLVSYWRLDDGGKDNRIVRNLVSAANYGTVNGGAKWVEPTHSAKSAREE